MPPLQLMPLDSRLVTSALCSLHAARDTASTGH